jgi:hypothetical protein
MWRTGDVIVVEGNQITLRRVYSSDLSSTTNPTWRVLGKNLDFLRATTRPFCTSGSYNEKEPSAAMEFAMLVVILANKLFAILLMLRHWSQGLFFVEKQRIHSYLSHCKGKG